MEKTEYYFVYGTLKRGYGNNRLFAQSPTAKFVEEAVTEPMFNLHDLGPFPGVSEDGETAVHGELWEVSDAETKMRLDRLEGYNPVAPTRGLYNKKVITVGNKQANIYLINEYNKNDRKLESGKWER